MINILKILFQGFDDINIKNVDLLTSFEVIEHFENPAEEFMKIFDLKPKIILILLVI